MSSTQLWRAMPEQIESLWPFVGPMIADSLKRASLMDEGFARACLDKGAWQLWVASDDTVRAIAITTIDDMPRGRLCTVILCTGDGMAEWVRHLASIEEWAVWRGCVRIKAVTRPGWGRVMKDYRKTHVVLEKDLGNVE